MDGAHGDAEVRGDLLVGEPVVTERQKDPLLPRQTRGQVDSGGCLPGRATRRFQTRTSTRLGEARLSLLQLRHMVLSLPL